MLTDKSALIKKMQNYLARREQSESELKEKLMRAFEKKLVLEVLEEFKRQGWQSDLRFAQMLIRSRIAQGYGRYYIHQELKQHQISDDFIEQAFAEVETNWQETLQKAFEKRYGTIPPQCFEDKLKCQQYLWRRGFSQDEVKQFFARF